jgi:hypothetical protein
VDIFAFYAYVRGYVFKHFFQMKISQKNTKKDQKGFLKNMKNSLLGICFYFHPISNF